MNESKTNLHLNHTQGNITWENLKMKRGIFEVDSLSPLISCLTLVGALMSSTKLATNTCMNQE